MIPPTPAPIEPGVVGSPPVVGNGVLPAATPAPVLEKPANVLDSKLEKRASAAAAVEVPATPGSTGVPTRFATPVPKGATVGSSEGVAINVGSGATASAKVPEIPKDIAWGKTETVVQAASPGGNIVKLTFAANGGRPARVTKVGDGDGVSAQFGDGSNVTCRVNNIDANEVKHGAYVTAGGRQMNASPDQVFGPEAQKYLENLILNKEVTVKVTQVKDGRNYCDIELQGKNIDLPMVKAGLAMVYRRFVAPDRKDELIAAEDKAKAQKLNIWSLLNPIAGEDFRQIYNPTPPKKRW